MKKASKKINPTQIKSLEVRLWNKTVGYLASTPLGISFEYEELMTTEFFQNKSIKQPCVAPLHARDQLYPV